MGERREKEVTFKVPEKKRKMSQRSTLFLVHDVDVGQFFFLSKKENIKRMRNDLAARGTCQDSLSRAARLLLPTKKPPGARFSPRQKTPSSPSQISRPRISSPLICPPSSLVRTIYLGTTS